MSQVGRASCINTSIGFTSGGSLNKYSEGRLRGYASDGITNAGAQYVPNIRCGFGIDAIKAVLLRPVYTGVLRVRRVTSIGNCFLRVHTAIK